MDIAGIIEQLQEERTRIDSAIEALAGQAPNGRVKRMSGMPVGKRSISTTERNRRSLAQKARWAKRETSTPKRVVSAAQRKRLSQSMKARWAERRTREQKAEKSRD